MDIFEKCFNYKTADMFKSQNLYPYFRSISSAQDTQVSINGESYLMLGSNSYLGLTNHDKVKQAAIAAIEKYGTGNAGSRFLNGTLDIHSNLEKKLAHYFGKEATLLCGTGWMANVGTISAIVGSHDYILCDRMNHSSIIDGGMLARAKKMVKYKHNDMEDLEAHIIRIRKKDPVAALLIVTDGVFSMEGDIVNLPELVKIKKKYSARILVDDAHATGVLGKKGEGTGDHFGLINEIDILTITFSKSLASLGGAVVGSQKLIDFLQHHSRTVIFSASMTPSSVASVDAALDIIVEEPQRITRLWEITRKMNEGFRSLGFHTGKTQTPIIPILIGSTEKTFLFWRKLTDHHIFVNPVVTPAVSEGSGLIRTSYMATHTDEQLNKALDIFEKIGKELHII